MLVTAVKRKYLQRIIFNFHKKNAAKATQDEQNDDEVRDDDDAVINNVVATLGRFCVSAKFSTRFARNIFAVFMVLAAWLQNCAKLGQSLHCKIYDIYEYI